MPYLIDGNNLLGAMRMDRQSEDSKRNLVRMLAAFARSKRARVRCIFDGPEPSSFARDLGPLTVVFSGARSADDLIAEQAGQGRGWTVITSDRALGARVQRRHVDVVAPSQFMKELDAASSEQAASVDDWAEYFSDPKNRLKF